MAENKPISRFDELKKVTGAEYVPVVYEGKNYKVLASLLQPDLGDYLTSKQAAQKYYPKVDGENLAFLVETLNEGLGDKEDRVTIETVNGESLAAKVGRYYLFGEKVNVLNVTLPDVEETSRLKSLVLSFTTGDAPSVAISATDDVAYFEGFVVEPGKTYELNIMHNGLKWIVAYGIVE